MADSPALVSPAVSASQSRQAADSSENTTTDTIDSLEPAPKRCKFDNKDQQQGTLESKLEERLSGILCCAVCLDVPGLSMFQASVCLSVCAILDTLSLSQILPFVSRTQCQASWHTL